jgi:hypothetical protein
VNGISYILVWRNRCDLPLGQSTRSHNSCDENSKAIRAVMSPQEKLQTVEVNISFNQVPSPLEHGRGKYAEDQR